MLRFAQHVVGSELVIDVDHVGYDPDRHVAVQPQLAAAASAESSAFDDYCHASAPPWPSGHGGRIWSRYPYIPHTYLVSIIVKGVIRGLQKGMAG